MKKVINLILILVLFMGVFSTNVSAYNYYNQSGDSIEEEVIDLVSTYDDLYMAVGGTLKVNVSNKYDYSISNTNIVSLKNNILTAKKSGKVKLSIKTKGLEEGEEDLFGHDITIYVRKYSFKTSYTCEYVLDSYEGLTVKIKDSKFDGNTSVSNAISSVKNAEVYVFRSNLNSHYFEIYTDSHKNQTITIKIDGKKYKIKINVVSLNKKNIVTYKGKKNTLKVSGKKIIKWTSTNKSIATVSKKGIVTAKKNGRCYIRAYYSKNEYIQCLVECTYKKAYQAVLNAEKDYKKMENDEIKYSQAKRMQKNYRDCSSFVARCYYDTSLKRKLVKIGSATALSAAEQAKWLYNHKKTVANGKISVTKLLPGDLVYSATGYAGKNKRWRNIDHASIYVGNGIFLDTSIGYSSEYDCCKYVGRPCK
jgi:hypothetical protein